jgi:small-conductance mechanosensitive channel
VKVIIHNILAANNAILKDPIPEVFLKEMSDTLIEFELRYYVNIREVKSRITVMSAILINIWDAFSHHGIKTPFPQREVLLRQAGSLPELLQEMEYVDPKTGA